MSRKQLQPARKRGRPSNAELAARAEAESLALLARLPSSGPAPEADGAAAPRTAAEAAGPDATSEDYYEALTTNERNDARCLRGVRLRDLAHARGISRSEMTEWDDDKVRGQLKMLLSRQYEQRDEYFDFLTAG
jgi:hypothetical protein